MPSSPTHDVAIWTLGQLWECFQTIELSASLVESCTRMEKFIYTLSLISIDNLALEQLQFSMWEAATLTSSSLGELRRKDGTMRRRMATSLLEDSDARTARAEVAITELILNGVRLSWQRQLNSFGNFATSWFRKLWFEAIHLYGSSATGSLHPSILSMRHPEEYGLTRQQLRESTSGSCRLIWDLEHLDEGMSKLSFHVLCYSFLNDEGFVTTSTHIARIPRGAPNRAHSGGDYR